MTDADDFDETLLYAAANGDTAAFSFLYSRHAAAVYRFAWSLSATEGVVEELLQETFLTCWAKRRTVRIVDESILPWLLVVCRNHARNLQRREARHRTLPLGDVEIADLRTSGVEGLAWLKDELSSLTPLDREVIELCLVGGVSYAEAARLLDVSANAVGKRLQKARARLREAAYDNGD